MTAATATTTHSHTIHVSDAIGDVSGILLRPPDARAIYVLAHGAGVGMRHAFMQSIADSLAERGFATLRYQFPYVEARRRPDDGGSIRAARGPCPRRRTGAAPRRPADPGRRPSLSRP